MKISDFVPNLLGGTDTEDAVSMLTADHDKVKGLFKEFEEVKDLTDQHGVKERQRIVSAACNELTVHTMIEDEIFYPAVRKAIDDDALMNEARVEHDGAKELIAQLGKMKPTDEMYTAKFTVLSEYVKHHIDEEHSEMFPKAKKSDLDLDALGKKMLARKQELMQGAKPAAKIRPQVKKRAAVPHKPATSRQNGAAAKL